MATLVDRIRGMLVGKQDSVNGIARVGSYGLYNSVAWGFTRVANSVYANPTGYRCVQKIADNFSRPEWEVYRPGTRDPLPNHPLLRVLNAPAPRVSGTQLQWRMARDLQLTGKWFALKMQGVDGFGNAGPVTGLRRLPPDRVSVVGNADDELVGFVYVDRNGHRTPALAEDIVYIRFPHPERDYDGMPPAVIAGLPAETDNGAARFNYDLLANDTALPGYISIENLTVAEFREWKASWEAGEYPGKTRFLSGKATYVKVGQTNQELTYGQLRQDSRLDITFAFGVPLVLLNPSDATFANMAEARATLMQQTISPIWTLVNDDLTAQLGADYGVDVGMKLSDIDELTEAMDSLVIRGVSLLDRRVITINEMREDLGKVPVAWGEAPILGVQPMMPAPLADVTAADSAQPTTVVPPKRGSKAASRPRVTPAEHLVATYEARLARKVRSFLQRQGRVIEARVRAQAGKSIKAVEQGAWWDDLRWMTELRTDLGDGLADVVDAFGTDAVARIGAGTFDATSPRAVKWIGERSDHVSRWVNDTTRDEMRQVIADGVSAGEGMDEIARSIRGYFEGDEAQAVSRATVVARTEVIAGSNQGFLEGMRQSGVVSGKTWLAAGSGVCAECEAVNGEEVGLDASFSSGDDAPPLHPQCRCAMTAVLDDGTTTQTDSEE